MAKYLRKYNKKTQSWEIISPNSANDVYVSNTNFIDDSIPITLDTTLNKINDSIGKLQRNVSWLAEHGGGNGIGGGVGVGSVYGIMVLNSGINNGVLYVTEPSCKIIFKVTGGTITDTIHYRVLFDGNYITNLTQGMVNNNITVQIDNLEKYSTTSPHTLIIEAVDKDGMSIQPYTLSIIESSIRISCARETVLRIGSNGVLNVKVVNKLIDTHTDIMIYNNYNAKSYIYSYTSTTSNEITIPIDFYQHLVDDITVGGVYNLEISGQVVTKESNIITASPITARVIIQDSNNIVLNVSGLKAINNDDVSSIPTYYLGENMKFAFTPYLLNNDIIYYAIRFKMVDSITNEENVMEGISDIGDYDLEELTYNQNPYVYTRTAKQFAIFFDINKNEYIGQWKVYIKCWSQNGMVHNESIYCFNIAPSEKEIFPKQIPHIISNLSGSTLFAHWDESNFPNNSNRDNIWKSKVTNYLLPNSTTSSPYLTIEQNMTIYGVNNVMNGFFQSPYKCLRLYSEAYAIANIKHDNLQKHNDEKILQNGFTISLCFKSDIHPSNINTIFQWGELSANDEITGIIVNLEEVKWHFKTGGIDYTIQTNIQQGVLTTIDFVYEMKIINEEYKGVAKIFINGVLNAAKEVGYYDTQFYDKMYLGCKYKNRKYYDYADVDIVSLNVFTHYLNDLEVVVNSHNLLCEKDSDGGIDMSKYNLWKKNNFFNLSGRTPESLIYDSISGYKNIGFDKLKSGNIPIPILYLDAPNIYQYEFEDTGGNVYSGKTNASMRYYDPKTNIEVTTTYEETAFSIQGTSTTTLGVKNIELYFTKELDHYSDNRTQLFQPKDDWFPESQFTLKADMVDSAHANNTTIGKWINECGLLENTPPMDLVRNNPPKDVVIIDKNGQENVIEHTTVPKVKHTTEGFPILLMIKFKEMGAPKIYGIYSFNLGRYSYFNLGLKILKNFSRRKLTNNGEINESLAPALINYYDYYQPNETANGIGSTQIQMKDVYSFEFGSDADINNLDYPTWSQDHMSIIQRIGAFKYNGNLGTSEAPSSNANIWFALQKLFTATSNIVPHYHKYQYSQTDNGYKEIFDIDGNQPSYNGDLNTYCDNLITHLSIKNSIAYFVIVNAFGMVDSLGKNFTLRTWNASSDSVKWYPCFYDMDTALGITNSGLENVLPTVYIDKYENQNDKTYNTLQIIRNSPPSSEETQNGSTFGAYNLKLWNILRSTADGGGVNSFKSTNKYQDGFYEDVWAILRKKSPSTDVKDSGLLSDVNVFIDRLLLQLSGCGELMLNQDYSVKYLTTYGGTTSASMLHGNRIEYIKKWLTDRWIFLDGVFENSSLQGTDLPFYKNGTFVVRGGVPILPLTIQTTSPCIITTERGQNGQIYKYFIPSYSNTTIKMPQDVSTDKRLSINCIDIITNIGGLKEAGLQRFETICLPKLSNLELGGVTSLVGDSNNSPIDFQTQLTYIKDEKIYSNVRSINLKDTFTENVALFVVDVNNFNKLKRIDIRNSCVTSLTLPSNPLDENGLLIANSKIENLVITNQPLLNNVNLSGCTNLKTIRIEECDNIKEIVIPELINLTSIIIRNCKSLLSFVSTNGNNVLLQNVEIDNCINLEKINIGNCYNADCQITINATHNLKELSIVTWYGSNIMLEKGSVKNVERLSLRGCYNLKGIKYIDENEIEYYKSNKTNDEGYVLNLLPFTSLSGASWDLTDCQSIEYLKMKNVYNDPMLLDSSSLQGCGNLKRIFGHYKLTSGHALRVKPKFQIFEALDNEISNTNLPEIGKFHNDNIDGYNTNLSLGVTSLTNSFEETNVTLKDVYYILQKCNDDGNIIKYDNNIYRANSGQSVSNLSLCFFKCGNIKCGLNNNLKRETFKYCSNVTNVDGMFLETNLSTVLYSPIINKNGDIISGGTMSYLSGMTNFNSMQGTYYIDTNFFQDEIWKKVKSINGFSPYSIKEAQENANTASTFVKSSQFFKKMKSLNTINDSFNNSNFGIEFENNVISGESGYLTYEENLFYNNPNLISIIDSFNNIKGSGDIKNMFGGYPYTLQDKDHFPQNLSAITSSFRMDGPILYIGDSFFAKIRSTIKTCKSGVIGGYGGTYYHVFWTKKVIDKDDIQQGYDFPYKIFEGCSGLTTMNSLFRGISGENQTSISIPFYPNINRSMFDDCKELTNIAYLFSQMNIPFKLEGFGFNNCSLTNVEGCFAGNNKIAEYIPYGLFYKEQQRVYKQTIGLTKEQAEKSSITLSYGIKNPILDKNGNITTNVVFDTSGEPNEYGYYPILSGGTEPDGETYDGIEMNYVDDYGFISSGTVEGGEEQILCPILSDEHTIFSGHYQSYATDIENAKGLFEDCNSSGITPYNLTKDEYEKYLEDANYDYDYTLNSGSTVNYNYGHIIEANDLYNTIYLLPNPNYNPILYKKIGENFYQNTNYDPRRYILNPNWNPYSKKLNIYINNGKDDLYDLIKESNLYKTLVDEKKVNPNDLYELKGINQELMQDRDMELMFGTNQTGEIEIDDNKRQKLNSRYYMFAPDLLRYCKNTQNLNITNLFKRQSDYGSGYLNSGLYGVLPPMMFNNISQVTNLTNCFCGVNVLPFSFRKTITNSGGTQHNIGIMFSDKLFDKLTNLTNLSYCFAQIHIPSSVQLPEDLFKTNKKLQYLNHLFYNVRWYGIYSDIKNEMQIPSNLFLNNGEITHVNSMFAYWYGSGAIDKEIRLSKIPNTLFSEVYHTKLNYISSLFAHSNLQVSEESDVITFWNWSRWPSSYLNCYEGVIDNSENGVIDERFK